METITDLSAIPGLKSVAEQMQLEIAKSNAQAQNIMSLKMGGIEAANNRMTRQQLESMLMNAERSLSNESSNRVLSHMFGKFTLLQKIMQNMG